MLQVFNRSDIEWVGYGNGDDAFLLIDRYYQVLQSEGPGDLVGDDIKFQLEGVYLDIFHAGRLGDQLRDGIFSQLLLCRRNLQAKGGDHLGGGGQLRQVDLFLGQVLGQMTVQPCSLGIAALENHLILFVIDSAALVKEFGNILNGQHVLLWFPVGRSTHWMAVFSELFFVAV